MLIKRSTFLSPFRDFPYFTKEMLYESANNFSLTKSTLNSHIYKALKNGEILSLKRNHYVSRNFYEAHKTEIAYHFSLANLFIKPSYISLESALQYHGLFAEAVNYRFTSVALKLPREFKNRIGKFTYRHISPSLFNNFVETKGKNFSFLIALPHKAIFDYLYYKTNRFRKGVHPDLIDELRIDTTSLPEKEKDRLRKLIARFTSIEIEL